MSTQLATMSAADLALADFEDPVDEIATQFELDFDPLEVVDILTVTSFPETTALPIASPKKAMNRKEELASLRKLTQYLEAQLGTLESNRAAFAAREVSTGEWEKTATDAWQTREAAERDNKRLKRAVEEQLAMIEAMDTMLRKRPRVENMAESLCADVTRLGDDDTRGRAMDRILEAHLSSLNHVFVRAKLIDTPSSEIKSAKILHLPLHDSLAVDVVRCWHLPYSFDVVAAAAWRAWTHQADDNTPQSKIVECLADLDTRYIRVPLNDTAKCPKATRIFTQSLFRRKYEATRVVILGRGILDDARHPAPGHVADALTWITVERVTETSCVYKCCGRRFAPTARHGRMRTVDEMVVGLGLTTAAADRDELTGMLGDILVHAYCDIGHRIEHDMHTLLHARPPTAAQSG
ncbi:Aste57867_18838 [Aphanomyces stellatus]|uniref:Aste57867_18838 protein n=1 Tax=Aphanomyces stellatus TaxID=120398 RepID=A0A485LFD8_9STRA|nr:hypothetical protein As57867_018774 [Aphanomyces stellatus]VFT95572.1 Aste57867_18838 [Aphanomyces stellatus]